MKLTICKIIIIMCIIAMSFLFYRNLKIVNEKIENQDIVLDLVESHDRYHEIYMKQYEGVYSRTETLDIIRNVYFKNSDKIVKPQMQLGNKVIKTEADLIEANELRDYGLYEFTYKPEADIIIVEGLGGDNNG